VKTPAAQMEAFKKAFCVAKEYRMKMLSRATSEPERLAIESRGR
jgi:hypothetical protein